MKLSIRDNLDKKSMRETNRWGKFNDLHYMVADQDIDSWRQEDYINVMYACRDLRRALDTYEKYGIDYENDPKYVERIEDMNAKISELIDIANQNAAQWAGESIVREDKSDYAYKRGKKCFVVVELSERDKDVPKLIGVFYNKKDAEEVAYGKAGVWRNVIESTIV